MYDKFLEQALLTKDQAIVYSVLLKNGPLPAGRLAKKTPLKRSLVYKILEQLSELELVEKKDSTGQITVFAAEHPAKLKDLAEKQESGAKEAQAVLDTIMASMVSDFNLVHGKPGIRFFEGVDGLKKIYDDILETGKDFYLVRSIFEPVYTKEIVPIIEKFIQKRVSKKMAVTALTPTDTLGARTPASDAKILFKRTWIDKKDYDVPVEIDIYGNKIAFLSFGKELIGVIIESAQIAQSLKKLFLLSRKAAIKSASAKSQAL